MLEEKFFWTSGPFFKAKFILLESDCSISGGLVFIYSAGHAASQFFTSYFWLLHYIQKKLPLVGSMLPPQSIGYSKLDSEFTHFIVNSNLPPWNSHFRQHHGWKMLHFLYLGIRFLPPFFSICKLTFRFFQRTGENSMEDANRPNQEAELLKLGHQLLQNAASKADAKRRSFHQQKVLHCKPRSCEGWVDDIDDILVVEFGAGKWSILIPEIVFEYIGP